MLPPEIWQTILRYAIAAPEFLDPDYWVDRFPPRVIEERVLLDFKSYKIVEFTRGTLQSVCRSWNEYLRQYAYRFVHMHDVVQGKVSADSLHSAIRISFEDSHRCYRKSFQPQHLPRADIERSMRAEYFKHCREILQREGPLRVEIIQCNLYWEDVLELVVSPDIFPNLASVHAKNDSLPATQLVPFIESYPSLRHMYTNCAWDHDTKVSLKSSTLTTLVFSLPILTSLDPLVTRESVDLPALRHLELRTCTYEWSAVYDENAWLPFLRIVGKELRTLFLPGELRRNLKDIPGEFWNICPKLEDVFFPEVIPTTPPPEGHPLHTIGINYYEITNHKNPRYVVPYWPGLRTVRVSSLWHPSWLSKGLELDLRFSLEDHTGDLYAEYLKRVESEENNRRQKWK
ncbi:hypothetical protein CPB86DRAFT_869033 [Serendipita vermifera]|nr:hypothetical protein CPB86DRAFT_869033 [Serendipita vermifera]